MTTTYIMRTDGRARTVAKDLMQIGSENGLPLKLSQAQKLAAHLFGYKNWADMVSHFVPDGGGPEDHELTEADLAERLAAQSAALSESGFSPDVVPLLLSRLRPTGRSEGAIEARTIAPRFFNRLAYHPHRLWDALDMVDIDIPTAENRQEDLYAEYLVKWAENRPLFEIDRLTLDAGDAVRNMLEQAFDLYHENYIIDAADKAADLASSPMRSDLIETIPFGSDHLTRMAEDGRNKITHYIHFGDDIFDGPYDDACIQGAYVTFVFELDGDEKPFFIEFTLISQGRDPATEEPGIALRNCMRANYLNYFLNEEHFGLAEIVDDMVNGDVDLVDHLWQPYLLRPVTAALNAVDAHYRHVGSLEFAIADGALPQFATRFDRAATQKDVMAAVRGADGFLPVCFLGGGVPNRPTDAERSRQVLVTGPCRSEEPTMQDVYALVWDHTAGSTSKGMRMISDKAIDVAAKIQTIYPGSDVLNVADAGLIWQDVQYACEGLEDVDILWSIGEVGPFERHYPLAAAAQLIMHDGAVADPLMDDFARRYPGSPISTLLSRFKVDAAGLEAGVERAILFRDKWMRPLLSELRLLLAPAQAEVAKVDVIG